MSNRMRSEIRPREGREIAEARCYLIGCAEQVNRVLTSFWDEKRQQWGAFPEIIRGAFDTYDRLTGDGKKIRAGLVCLGHEVCCHSGSPQPADPDAIYRAAGCVEILHNAFLIHDDIVDHSDLRRSQVTAHRHYADLHRDRFQGEAEALAYGCAVALNFGDKGQALAEELLLASRLPAGVLLAAIELLSRVTAETVAGQLLDVADRRLPELTEEQVLQIHEYKTAHYTIMLPLQLGAILAAAEPGRLGPIRDYAIPLGIAFQIQDDILGLYGDEAMLGKPVGSDVREGKKTLLYVHAYETASPDQRRFLERVHGNPELSVEDLEGVRELVRQTGALERSRERAHGLVDHSKRHIVAITTEPRWQQMLSGLADYLIARRT